MNNNLRIFENEEFGKVRTLIINEESWFVGKDVAKILGYSNASKAVLNHVSDEDKQFLMFDIVRSQNRNVPIGQSKTAIINESGLYSLIISSKLPTAKKIKHWITSEVLPSIHKHGAYMTPEKLKEVILNPDTMIELCRALKTEREQRIKLEQEDNLLIPDANMARDIIKYNGLYTLKEVADLIEKGRIELCTLLRTSEVLSKQTGYNLPLRRYTKQGYFKIKINEKTNVPVTLITAKGLRFIYRLIKKYDLVDEFDTYTLLETAKDMEMVETA